MKKLLIILLLAYTLTACTKEQPVQQCGEVVSSRICGVCTAQPRYVIDVYFKETGATVGFQSSREYAVKEIFCVER